MCKSNRFKSLVAAGLLAGSVSVQAASYEFGPLLTGSSVYFDYGPSFGKKANFRPSGNDVVSWSVVDLSSDSTLSNMHIHAQGKDGGYTAKYAVEMTPVPEPETYAMLLAGLGLIGLSLRRRNMDE